VQERKESSILCVHLREGWRLRFFSGEKKRKHNGLLRYYIWRGKREKRRVKSIMIRIAKKPKKERRNPLSAGQKDPAQASPPRMKRDIAQISSVAEKKKWGDRLYKLKRRSTYSIHEALGRRKKI